MGTILIIEDDPSTLKLLEAIFRGGLHMVKSATTFQEVLDLLDGLKMPIVALVDEEFPGGNGAQTAKILRDKIPGVKLISTSSKEDKDIAWKRKPDARFRKPFSSLSDLSRVVEELMQPDAVP